MIRSFALACTAMLIAAPAMAAGATCSDSPSSKFQPISTLEAQLKGEGMKVLKIKTEKGCYEVYAIDKDGKKVNVAYNAETLERLADAEAGEN